MVMFILFGTKKVKSSVKNGLNLRRQCDRCQFLSDLQEHRFRQYFALFFIPVFPVSKGESLLVCNRCQATFYIQAEDYLASEMGGSVYSTGDAGKSSSSGGEKMVIVCDYCGGRLRIPLLAGRKLVVTCPHCKKKFDVKVNEGA